MKIDMKKWIVKNFTVSLFLAVILAGLIAWVALNLTIP